MAVARAADAPPTQAAPLLREGDALSPSHSPSQPFSQAKGRSGDLALRFSHWGVGRFLHELVLLWDPWKGGVGDGSLFWGLKWGNSALHICSLGPQVLPQHFWLRWAPTAHVRDLIPGEGPHGTGSQELAGGVGGTEVG